MNELEERQEQELVAVKSIYPELIDLREEKLRKITQQSPGHHKKQKYKQNWRPIEIQITLKPDAEKVFVKVDLYIKCNHNYPKEIPNEIKIKNVTGLSNHSVLELEKQLKNLAKELSSKDEEMIFLLINMVENFLDQNNNPVPESFYDQMVSDKLKVQEEAERLSKERLNLEKEKEEEKQKILMEAMDEKFKLLEEESKNRRKIVLNNEVALALTSLKNKVEKLIEKYSNIESANELVNGIEKRTCLVNHQLIDCKFKVLSGNEIHVQKYSCLFHGKENQVDYLGIQIKKDSTPQFLISEWQFSLVNLEKNTIKEETSRIMKYLGIIKFIYDHHILHLNYKYMIQSVSFSYGLENDLIVLRLLQKDTYMIRFADLPIILNKQKLDHKTIAHYFIQILDALNFLHEKQLIHGNLNEENVMLDLNTGKIKLGGTLIQKLINDFSERLKSNGKMNISLETIINFQMKDLEIDYNRFALLMSWFFLDFKVTYQQIFFMKQNDLIKILHDKNLDECTLSLIKNCVMGSSLTILEPLLLEYFEKNLDNYDLSDIIMKKKLFNQQNDVSENKSIPNDNNKFISYKLANKNSRLRDYEIISKIGHGGFGEVYKVRNILDQNEYALKKIKINTSNKLLNKKIKQEVRYLSGLNHENVVRYFGAWVEYELKEDVSKNLDKDDLDSFDKSLKFCAKDSIFDSEDEDLSDDEVDAKMLFSNSLKFTSKIVDEEISDDYVHFEQESKAGVDFVNDNLDEFSKPKLKLAPKFLEKKLSSNISPYNEIMYIQMELCEKSTLQNAIQNEELYRDNRRKKRLFRELIEGLAHIHEKEIIHRDLKPGNIFLDAFDHVKIGDFGLATNDIIHTENQQINNSLIQINQQQQNNLTVPINNHQAISNPSMSTFNKESEIVGTPFYLSPEILAKSSDMNVKKIIYTQKVDIYSVGVIFFEMCYPSPATGMERFKLLTNLRDPKIIFPEDVDNYLSEQEKKLINLLLNHNPVERPSSSELLQSEYLPPLEIEEEKQQTLIKHVIANPRSKQFKFLLNSLFNYEMDPIDDIVYDSEIDVIKSKKMVNNEQIKPRLFQFVSDRLINIMKKYGAIRFTVPTFMPIYSLNNSNLNYAFSVMDNNGNIITPPYDLRVPFARFIARNQTYSLRSFKRFAIEKVYRSRLIGYHPRELWECAFDIVTTQTQTPNLWSILPDVEVLQVLNDIIDSFDCLRNKPFTLCINSIKFLKAVFTYFEIDESKIDLVLKIIAESNDKNLISKTNDGEYSRTPRDYINYMISSRNILDLNKTNILIQMLEKEKTSVKEMIDLVHFYMRRKPQIKQQQAYDNALNSLKELGLIVDCFQNSCSTFRMKIKFVPNLVLNVANCNIYSNLIFQLQYEVVKKRQILKHILATGGRYDDLINDFSVNFSNRNDPINKKALVLCERRTGVGLSLEIEKIVKFLLEDEDNCDLEETGICDIVLYSEIYDDDKFNFIYKDLCEISYNLRQLNYRVKAFTEKVFKSITELSKYCIDNLVKFAFLIIRTSDSQLKIFYCVRTLIYDKEKVFEKRSSTMNRNEVLDYIRNELQLGSNFNSANNNFSNLPNQSNCNYSFETSCTISGSYTNSSSANFVSNSFCSNSNLKYVASDKNSHFASATNIQFINIEKTFELLSKKKVMNLIMSLISNRLNFFVNSKIEVLALEIPFKIIKLIAFECDLEKNNFGNIEDEVCEQCIRLISEKYPRYKIQISEVLYKVCNFKRKREPPVIILISLYEMLNFRFVIIP